MSETAHDPLRAPRDPLRDWYRQFPPFTVGGSLYAVPPAHRAATAAALAARDCRVHIDIIVDATGRGLGVSARELAEARAAAPYARIDLHLIVADTLPAALAAEVVGETVATALRTGAEAVTMDLARIGRHPAAVEALHRGGVALWLEHTPRARVLEVPPGVDGALVMFIPPGTKQSADPSMLTEVGRLAATLPTAVDGGITAPVAARCAERGAAYIVAGRSLLTAAVPSAPAPAPASVPASVPAPASVSAPAPAPRTENHREDLP
ncbi:beta/alpha barrel domain-containing protein [Streptomyces paludis]|uniref:Ribulose-phosphate 3-epimerase n=1 Tax=Streptomyces paludis TaxID=2282738 RepID=A0A345HY84_9ACTN|nr:hypothetical protein [Streptomyces paludis]AXG81658.1 hypothetical protein DVK44_32505 [Streptomyces paludis]